MTISVNRKKKKSFFREVEGGEKPAIEMRPGNGSHLLWYQGSLLWVQRSEGDPMTTGKLSNQDYIRGKWGGKTKE